MDNKERSEWQQDRIIVDYERNAMVNIYDFHRVRSTLGFQVVQLTVAKMYSVLLFNKRPDLENLCRNQREINLVYKWPKRPSTADFDKK